MSIQPTSSLNALTGSSPAGLSRGLTDDARRIENQDLFRSALAKAGGEREQTPEQRARTGAEQLVAQALVNPMLKQMRQSSQAAPPFAPSQAEKSFRGLMDAELSQRMVRSGNWALVDRLAQDMLRKVPTATPTRSSTTNAVTNS